jgi:hypothetical protein
MVLELAHHDLFDEVTASYSRGRFNWVRQTFKEILHAIQAVHGNGKWSGKANCYLIWNVQRLYTAT